MAKKPKKDEVRLRVHGLTMTGPHVRASEFARQLAELVRGLEAADLAANGTKKHDYLIEKLENASAGALVREVVTSTRSPQFSGIETFALCATSIARRDERWLARAPDCFRHIRKIAERVDLDYAFTDLEFGVLEPVRIDKDYAAQADQMQGIQESVVRLEERFYSGTSRGTFDGTIKEVDLRGNLPRMKVVLTAGGAEIDCSWRASSEEIRTVLDRRTRIEATAYYSEKKALPTRLEIHSVEMIKQEPDFLRWKGAFDSLVSDDWDMNS